jgi:hypothetical protein
MYRMHLIICPEKCITMVKAEEGFNYPYKKR